MGNLPDVRAESVFDDFKPAYTPNQAVVEAHRCLYCYDAPCITACPTGIDIPEFIRKIATGNVRGSAKTIFDSNILGMSCARVCPVEVLCVGDCVFNEMGVPPIQIGKLQRYSTDLAYEQGWSFYEAGPDTGLSVGLIGAGPASLAAAHRLRRFGHACTIYDKREVIGGLNTTGVAPYKMQADKSVEEAEWVLAIGGVDIVTGVSIPGDLSWAELEERHDALFIGFGLGADSWLQLPGSDLEGLEGAVEIIERLKLGHVDLAGVERAVVIGGGNTAIDAVRELVGLGVEHVTMAYRGGEHHMSGYDHEWVAAKQEGALVQWHAQPVAFEGDERVSAVRFLRTDEHKHPIADSEFTLPADLVLLAVGQAKLGDLVADFDGVGVEWGCLVTDERGATSRPGVYAGGDCCNGGKEVVDAVAAGRDAAVAIHEYLTDEDA